MPSRAKQATELGPLPLQLRFGLAYVGQGFEIGDGPLSGEIRVVRRVVGEEVRLEHSLQVLVQLLHVQGGRIHQPGLPHSRERRADDLGDDELGAPSLPRRR